MSRELIHLKEGQRFGKLTYIAEAPARYSGVYRKRYVIMKCDCGSVREVNLVSLFSKKYPVLSCGCRKKDGKCRRKYEKGVINSPFFNVWNYMKSKVRAEKCPIKSEWLDFFEFKKDFYEEFKTLYDSGYYLRFCRIDKEKGFIEGNVYFKSQKRKKSALIKSQ